MKQDPRVSTFKQEFYSQVSDTDWSNWRWQLRHRIRDLEGAERIFQLTDSERQAIQKRQGLLPLGITPYYAALLDRDDAADPLRRTKIPSMEEFKVTGDECEDPLGEDAHSPVPGLVHTYPDKALFLVTDFCATYCRYCTRARMVGGGEFLPEKSMWENALDYIRAHPEIRDVLLSGGDPLILSDARLEWVLSRLAEIPHVEFLRIGTKVPAVLPYRITDGLLGVLKKYHPLFFSIHFTHPNELTLEVQEACNRLADAGIPMGGQTVLLKGVNDDPEVMKALNLGLLKVRCKPYYLHQCDPIQGSAHFRTSVEDGQALIRSLHGHTTGYAVPTYMVDTAGGGGKVPVGPEYIQGRDGDYLKLKNFQGRDTKYWDPE
ncbi:KamA family radical SAM protein [Kiritimatiellaeota bacterium B1221]|nr:KamA family radical SAM protein [Kiritimatiellaeota bacterium B1221]